jgi:hypothetical protein
MEWLGSTLLGFLVLVGLGQLFWTYCVGVITQKTDQSSFMQILAWIPLLQIAPTLAAGGGSIGRFVIGTIALVIGNAALIAVSTVLGSAFGRSIAGFGLGLTALLCLFYFGRIACNTAIARNLPGWMGLLLFVPILNFFVYAYFALHDGWIGPHKVGLAIGSVLILGSLVPSFGVVRMLDENGGLPPELVRAMTESAFVDLGGDGDQRTENPSNGPPGPAQREVESIRVLYQLKGRFDTLESLASPSNLLIHDQRVRALGIVQSVRADLESHRETLDALTFQKLATHLLAIEARVDAPTATASRPPHIQPSTRSRRDLQFVPAALDPSAESAIPSYSGATHPPIRPYPLQLSNDCPPGTKMHTTTDMQGEEEWCQQRETHGGLRHGPYARYQPDGGPESMGEYQDGLRVGVWTRFYSTGKVRAQAEFRKGLQHGWVVTFDEAGERTRGVRFENGVRVVAN